MDDRSVGDRSKPGQLVPTSATYEIFVPVLAIASLLSLALQLLMPMPARMRSSLVLMGNGISFVFLGDFL